MFGFVGYNLKVQTSLCNPSWYSLMLNNSIFTENLQKPFLQSFQNHLIEFNKDPLQTVPY